jgi:hypothetical protein
VKPTAVQSEDVVVHDTPLKPLSTAPVGLGVVWIDHPAPFHRSPNVVALWALLTEYPAAAQVVAEVHDTPLSWLDAAPAGLGVVWIDQLVPFQRSAKVT